MIANLKPHFEGYQKRSLVQRFSTLHFPIGLGIIAAVLKEKRWDYDVYDSYVNGTTGGFLKRVEKLLPDVVLLSGFLGNYSYRFCIEIAKKIKKINRNIFIIIGGPMATTIPELLISHTLIDFVVKGEGELTIVELLDVIEKNFIKEQVRSVRGIYFKEGGKIIFTGERDRMMNLNAALLPFYEAFPIEKYISYLKNSGRCWEISASRGCYGRCRFCKLTFGKRITCYSPELIIKHMLYVKENYGIERFNFVDDNFLNSPRSIEEFISLLKNKYPGEFKWRFQGRADRISMEMVERMAEVGLFDISFGIESGSQDMLNRYDKNLDIKKAILNLKSIKNLIDIHCTFIVGGPGENWGTVKETERFIRQLKLNNAAINILTLFPGTILYDEAIKSSFIRDEHRYAMNLGAMHVRPYVNISDMSNDDLLKAREMLTETAAGFGDYI
ncbi:MAG: radical SAM protein [Candidatus Omnitrophota bacterium]|nr:radical SAM protein [Candidatus Omnitrophota bacterium]